MSNSNTILALDVGDVRIGVARANTIAKIAEPLVTIEMNDTAAERVAELTKEQQADCVVVGLPRNMAGDETAQTEKVRAFVAKLEDALDIPVKLQDESLTSVKAEEILEARKSGYNKGDVDALAAALILEDYLGTSEN